MTEEERARAAQRLLDKLHRHFDGDYTKMAEHLAQAIVSIPDAVDKKVEGN